MLSQRKLSDNVAGCIGFEFEDTICELDTIDMVTPTNPYNSSREIFQFVKKVTRSYQLADWVRPDPNPYVIKQEYDLLFVPIQGTPGVLTIRSLKGWREKCKKAICFIWEIWERDIESWRPFLRLLKDFDHVFIGHYYGTQKIADIVGRPCTYLAPGVDAIRFCPYPKNSTRTIDVSYVGRRSPITHQALIDLVEKEHLFYFFDSPKKLNVRDPKEHRLLYASILKHSQYFIANQAKANQPGQRMSQSEFGYRFFEGAAAGTVMIGEHPKTDAFNEFFGWQDSVIWIPFDAPNIADILADLNAQPQRLNKIRRDNIVNSLLRHDWLYRWEQVLKVAGMENTPAMETRQNKLKELVSLVNSEALAA